MLFKKKELKIPQHIAFICDGNRRWARGRGMPATAGHAAGADILEPLCEYFFGRGTSTLSFYIFSIENWKRDSKEVKFLMSFFEKEMPKHVARAHEKNIRIKFIGRHDYLPKSIVKMCAKYEKETGGNDAGTGDVAPNLRQARLLREALDDLEKLSSALALGYPPDILGVHLETAAHALAEVTGVLDNEALLDSIFSSFCIGK